MNKVIGLGALNVDNIFKVENLLLEENSATPIEVQAGGSAANTIVALAKIGIPCGFVGVVATDAYGQLLISEFKRKRVDTKKIIRRTSNIFTISGLVEAYVDKGGRRQLFIKPGVNNSLKLSEIDINYLNSAPILHLASFVGDEQLEIQKKIIPQINQNVKISFSPGSIYCERGIKAILPIFKRSFVIFLDRREIYKLTGQNFKKGSEELLKLGPEIIVATLGKDGCYVASQKNSFIAKAKNVKAIDTTGAGDAFAAGFLYGILKKLDLIKSAEIGNTLASFSIKKVGSRNGLPNRKELASVISLPK